MKSYSLPAILLLSGLWTACSHGHSDDTGVPATAKGFALTDTMMSRIQTDVVKLEPIRSQLRLTGKVVPDENRVIKVFPLVGGYVRDVRAELGDYVQKGQVLAVIKSGEVASYDRELLEAQSDVRVAEKNLRIAQEMKEDKLNAERDVILAQKELERAKAELDRISEIFRIFSVNSKSEYVVKSPISGYVIQKEINRDMQLRSDDGAPLFVISQLNQVWIMANVNESDIGRTKLGLPATIQTLSYPDQTFRGEIDKIYNVLDPETKTMQVRIRLDNSKMLLKPEMHATVYIGMTEGGTMTAVPAKSVIFDKSKSFVMVFRDRQHIDTREVSVYRSQGDLAYIQKGLKAGERVISKYQLLVYDALND